MPLHRLAATRILAVAALLVGTLPLLGAVAPEAWGADLGNAQRITAIGGAGLAVLLAARARSPHRNTMLAILATLAAAGAGQGLLVVAADGAADIPRLGQVLVLAWVLVGFGLLAWAIRRELGRPELGRLAIDAGILVFTAAATVCALERNSAEELVGSVLGSVLATAAIMGGIAAWVAGLLVRRVAVAAVGPWMVLAGLSVVGAAAAGWVTWNGRGAVSDALVSTIFATGTLLYGFGGATWGRAFRHSAGPGRIFRWITEAVPIGAVVLSIVVISIPHVPYGLDPVNVTAGVALLMATTRLALLVKGERRLEADRARLATAIDQSPESIVITDTVGTIEYVNPACERVSGYSRDEVLGRNPRIFKSGLQPDSFYRAMWAALAVGAPWVADFMNRRKDGSLYMEEATVSPVRDPAGRITGYVAVKRDVTRERALEDQAARLARERGMVARTIAELRRDAQPQTNARIICDRVVALPGFGVASIVLFAGRATGTTLAIATASGSRPARHRLPPERLDHLRERAGAGPWVERWTGGIEHPYGRVLRMVGATDVAYAPLRYGSALLGVLAATNRAGAEVPLADELPALVDFAGLTSAILGPQLVEHTAAAEVRARLDDILAGRRFRPVFQPIVDTDGGRVVAYEALTRFDDGVSPNLVFADAEQAGIGLRLERATMAAAIQAARGLAPGVPLHVNVSGSMVLAAVPLRDLAAGAGRPLVLEVTEHAAIADYRAFRSALAGLGAEVELAVDDAGAGFASLRHILELRPKYVKLDGSLVREIENDPARAALVTGMVQFAKDTRIHLIAEGVETSAQLRVLRERGVPLAQGYLLGKPAPAERVLEVPEALPA